MCLMDMGKTRHADGQTGVSDAIEQRAVFFDFFCRCDKTVHNTSLYPYDEVYLICLKSNYTMRGRKIQ